MKNNQVRIIGGSLRGRKLSFPDTLDLRPTPNRVRETLFNWLAPFIRHARCLDLFSGSGALSVEALSRGALNVTAVEKNSRIVTQLTSEMQRLGIKNIDIIQANALEFLRSPSSPFNIIFVDPPYNTGLLLPCLTELEKQGWLTSGTLIYYEHNAEVHTDQLSDWQVLKQKRAGNVHYYLAVKKPVTLDIHTKHPPIQPPFS